jgi:sugar phosphate isomerase/epimerase
MMAKSQPQLAVVAFALSAEPRLAIQLARGAGFAALQLEWRSEQLDVTALSGTGRRELRTLLRSSDLGLSGLRIDLGGKGIGPSADVDALLARMDAVMQAAVGLAAPLVCVDVGPLPAPQAPAAPKASASPLEGGLIIIPPPAPVVAQTRVAQNPDPALAAGIDRALAELGGLADRYSIALAFRSELAGFDALERALRAADCPWFGIDLDPVAVLRDQWTIDEIFSRLGTMIRHVRGRDAILGADRRTKPAVIRRGSVQWDQLLGRLMESDYRGWITVDSLELPDPAAAAADGAASLRILLPT